MGQRSVWRRRLWRYERNGADVEDILQDALLQAHLCLDRYRGESSFETWFTAVVLNVARQHVAREVRRGALIEAEQDESSADAEASSQPPSYDEAACPAYRAWLQRFAVDVTQAMHRLPEDLKRTFELACLEERSYIEVATELGVPVGTIRSRVNRARSALRTMLRAK